MRIFLTLFGGLSLLFCLAIGSFIILLNFKGDVWLDEAIKAEFQQRFDVEPEIGQTHLLLFPPGLHLKEVKMPIEKPPLKIQLNELKLSVDFNPIGVISEEPVFDFEFNLEKPEVTWGK